MNANPLEELLDDAVAILDQVGLPWAVIGGCARNAYAEPRATRDVDFVVEARADGFSRLSEALQTAGFQAASAVRDPDDDVPDLVLYRDASGRRIDILFAHTAFERSALSRRAALAPFGRTTAQVVSVEDLIVYKLISNRAQDRADIAAVVDASDARGVPVDWAYIERWCNAWTISDRLAELRGRLGSGSH